MLAGACVWPCGALVSEQEAAYHDTHREWLRFGTAALAFPGCHLIL